MAFIVINRLDHAENIEKSSANTTVPHQSNGSLNTKTGFIDLTERERFS